MGAAIKRLVPVVTYLQTLEIRSASNDCLVKRLLGIWCAAPEDSLSFTALANIRTLSVKWRRVISSFLSRVSDCGKFAYDIIKLWPHLGANVSGYPKLLLLRQPQYSQSRYSHHEIGPKAYLAPASREITTLIERIPTMWLLASWFEAVWSSYFFWLGMDWFGSQVLSALCIFAIQWLQRWTQVDHLV